MYLEYEHEQDTILITVQKMKTNCSIYNVHQVGSCTILCKYDVNNLFL